MVPFVCGQCSLDEQNMRSGVIRLVLILWSGVVQAVRRVFYTRQAVIVQWEYGMQNKSVNLDYNNQTLINDVYGRVDRYIR